jgi:predicted DNA-binding WGR domain protein
MRRFEYVGGTSEKFWEVEREGTEVTVRFGRLGTNGQTQTKDLGTEAAATAHLERLVADKVKKGYVEGVASAAAPAPASAAAPARAPAPATAPTPAPEAESRPLPDETTFSLPPAWARQAEPFRGRRPAPPIDPVPSPPELAARMEKQVTAMLRHPNSDSALVERAERHAGRPSALLRRARQEDDALGAAALVAAACAALDWRDRAHLPRLADDLVLRHGLPFAAEVGALLTTVVVTAGHPHRGYIGGAALWLVPAGPADLATWAHDGVLARLRAHLAGTDDATYSEAAARLASVRAGAGIAARVVTSYLAPSEQHWVDEDVAAYGTLQASHGRPLLLASATTRTHVDAVLAVCSPGGVLHNSELVYSLAANLGTEAVDPLARLLDQANDAASTKRLLGMLAAMPTDAALEALLDRIDQKYVTPVVIEAMARFPARSLRLLAARSSGSSAAARTCRELLRGHLISNPGLADRLADEIDPHARRALDAITESTAAVAVADESRLLPLLVSPPWVSQVKRAKPPAVTGLESRAGLALRWLPGEQETHGALKIHHWGGVNPTDWKQSLADAIGPAARHRWPALRLLALAPPELVRPYLATFAPEHLYNALEPLQRILARLGDADAAAFVVRVASTKPTSLAPALLPVEGPEVAERMAEWLVRAKSVRPVARAWLERHAAAAARDLAPAALSKPGIERAAAEAALRVIDQAGHGDAIRAAAAAYGDEALAGIDVLLAADPLEQLPSRMPAPPSWLDPAHLPQVLLPGREAALPVEAVGHICTMLALSKPGETYAGIAIVREATDPASLAEMAWGLFERWQAAGFPSKEAWVLEALGLLGDDETVRRLAPLIRAWPGEGAHARAVAGLDVLAAIGTDVALMHLHAIAEKAKFKGLKTNAKAKMAEVAEGLGLTAEQLADRLVPDFGLDRDGTMVLDYGPRQFKVGFDEQLRPIVADDDGSRRKVLPKPAAKDDPVLATAAYAAFGGLKKDVKTIAADQIRRFERAMVQSRRWRAEEHRTLFVEHPLLWHLARRLVWATFDADGAHTASFRVAEDRTLAGAGDEELSLDADVPVGIAHPLHLGDEVGTWSDLFADYEILQPFPQLGRDTWQLTDGERHGRVLQRLAGVTVDTGRVLGLSHRGWERGPVMDGGIAGVVQKALPDGNVLVIDLDPGLIAGAAMEWKEQKITGVWISRTQVEWGSSDGEEPFSVLDDVAASELIRDLEHLRG